MVLKHLQTGDGLDLVKRFKAPALQHMKLMSIVAAADCFGHQIALGIIPRNHSELPLHWRSPALTSSSGNAGGNSSHVHPFVHLCWCRTPSIA